jgi:predicted ABC-type ATPase
MAAKNPIIYVLAGVNGAGKSSIGGALLSGAGLTWFNPDSMARAWIAETGKTAAEANAAAWAYGASRLQDAIDQRRSFAFETTLGGATMTAKLTTAAATHDIIMLFCGLASVDLHIERVALRVASGGHEIPEEKIRERWTTSRANLIKLLPCLAHLQVFDNSASVKLGQDIKAPQLILEMALGKILFPDTSDQSALFAVPNWARPIVQAALDLET